MVRARKRNQDGRTGNGGARQGTQGAAYANRSDLQAAKIQTAGGQPYGARTAQEQAQRAVPMAAAAPPPTAPAGAPGPLGPTPGSFGAFDRSTDRPGEPLTTGIALGPGGGPEAMAMNRVDPDLEALRPYLPTLELLASQPNTSPTARNFIRRLRAMSMGMQTPAER